MNGDEVLTLERVELAYCLNCRRPCHVGVLAVKGWRHVLAVCDVCLRRVQETVAAASIGEGENGKEAKGG